jgi:hypothetical protein
MAGQEIDNLIRRKSGVQESKEDLVDGIRGLRDQAFR